jgi:P2-related tail formation protein
MSEKTFSPKEVEEIVKAAVKTTIKEIKKEDDPAKMGTFKTVLYGVVEGVSKNLARRYNNLEEEAKERQRRLTEEEAKEKAAKVLNDAMSNIDPVNLAKIVEAIKKQS